MYNSIVDIVKVYEEPTNIVEYESDDRQALLEIFGAKSVDIFNDTIKWLRRNIRKNCYERFDGVVDCTYNYKRNKRGLFFRHPFLALTRGLVVRFYKDRSGRIENLKVVAIPFAKFFNLHEIERDGMMLEDEEVRAVLEKKDGTLIILWRDPDTDDIRANTKGDISPTNPFVDAFWEAIDRRGARSDVEYLVMKDKTVLMELTGNLPASKGVKDKNGVLLGGNYKPYLLAVRDNKTLGLYPSYMINVDLPKPITFTGTVADIKEMVDRWENKEGVVVYTNGLYDERFKWWNKLVKIKSTIYILSDDIKSGTISEYKLLKYVVFDRTDDILPTLPEELKQKVISMEEWYEKLVNLISEITNRKGYEEILKETNNKWLIKYIQKYKEPNKIVERLLLNRTGKKVLKSLPRLYERLSSIYQETSRGER